jgi:hypothetical protein
MLSMDRNHLSGNRHIVVQQHSERLSNRVSALHQLCSNFDDMNGLEKPIGFNINNHPGRTVLHLAGELITADCPMRERGRFPRIQGATGASSLRWSQGRPLLPALVQSIVRRFPPRKPGR